MEADREIERNGEVDHLFEERDLLLAVKVGIVIVETDFSNRDEFVVVWTVDFIVLGSLGVRSIGPKNVLVIFGESFRDERVVVACADTDHLEDV